MSLRFLRKKAKAYHKKEDGVAMMEMALVLPILVLLLFGTIETFFVFDSRSKAKRVAGTLAQLISQEHLITDGDQDDFMNAVSHLMFPHDFDTNTIQAGASVWEIGGSTPREVWSVGSLKRPANAGLLKDIMTSDREEDFTCPYVIIGSVDYKHKENSPIVSLFSDLVFQHDVHYFPRAVDQIRIKSGNTISILDGCEIDL